MPCRWLSENSHDSIGLIRTRSLTPSSRSTIILVEGGSANEELREASMRFVRRREGVDEQPGKTQPHYQLVEDRPEEGGNPRRRVVAHLGGHPTLEDAAAALRQRLRELEPRLGEHRREAEGYASKILREYSGQLRKYHESRIPTRNEDHRLAWPKPWATEEGRRYMRGFGRVELKSSLQQQGQTYEAYEGYEAFGAWLRLYWWHQEEAARLRRRMEELSAKLSEFERLSGTGSDYDA